MTTATRCERDSVELLFNSEIFLLAVSTIDRFLNLLVLDCIPRCTSQLTSPFRLPLCHCRTPNDYSCFLCMRLLSPVDIEVLIYSSFSPKAFFDDHSHVKFEQSHYLVLYFHSQSPYSSQDLVSCFFLIAFVSL